MSSPDVLSSSYSFLLGESTQPETKIYDKILYLLHGYWDNSIFIVFLDKENLLFQPVCNASTYLIFSPEEVSAMEEEAIDWFRHNRNFANYTQCDGYRGIQWGFYKNQRLHAFLETQASDGNIYCQDYLLFDALQTVQYHPNIEIRESSYRDANTYYGYVKDPKKLPLNPIYRAILFKDYSTLKRISRPFETAFIWNLPPQETSQGYLNSLEKSYN